MKILTLNAGSNSLKFEIIASEPGSAGFGRSLVSGAYDNVGKENARFALLEGKEARHQEQIEIRDHGHAAELLLDWMDRGGAKEHGIARLADIDRIGHRVVHGADRFSGPARIDDDVVRQIEDVADLAPLHNESALQVIRAAQAKLGQKLPMIAMFDTVFHRTIPERAAFYPLPVDVARRHGIRRYGFHGISHNYLMRRYGQIARRPLDEINLITLHLEGGCSAAAIQHGKSVDTSMGFTPLEGLMMGTRCGDIDPAIVTYLMRKEGMSGDEVEKLLNKKCGLLGVSGSSADTRDLRQHLDDRRVDLALNMFCYRVRKYIGAYMAVLGGVEAIVLGGGISENTAVVRERACQGFEWCGAVLDPQRNDQTIDREGPITTPESSVQIWVIPTQEGLMMAKDVADFAEA
jgi:acetate kinase